MISGSICYAAWISESDLAVALAINRLLFFTKPHLCDRLFNNKNQTLIIFIVALIHAFIVQISTDVLTFNSIYGAYFFNPHHGYPQPDYKVSD
uniref:Uncharacterized protein n=1 Tax=Panagrolaimus davidi TaxID=227884 RepID=A0A914QKS7_9BILA